MRGRRLPWKAIPAAALAGSQLGHLLVYTLRLGPEGLAASGSGAHGYLPSLATALAGLTGASFLAALAVLAASRILAARGGRGVVFERPSVFDLLAVLFAAQLCLFAVQETAEALLTGRVVRSVADLLLWGTLGQLPIAALAALALSWLTASFRRAIHDLSQAGASARMAASARPEPAVHRTSDPPLLVWSPGHTLPRRGPPVFPR
jgi:hypothetical protein